MPSIYQRALGSDFQKLHPKIQQRFGFSSDDGVASVGSGIMEEIWRGGFYTIPFLYLGAIVYSPSFARSISTVAISPSS